MHPQQKGLQGQEISGIGCLKIFLVKGKNPMGEGVKSEMVSLRSDQDYVDWSTEAW